MSLSLNCPNCKQEYGPSDRHCPNCGQELSATLSSPVTQVLNQAPASTPPANPAGEADLPDFSSGTPTGGQTGGFPPVVDNSGPDLTRPEEAGEMPSFWQCGQCVSLNPSYSDYCETCGALKPSAAPVQLSASQQPPRSSSNQNAKPAAQPQPGPDEFALDNGATQKLPANFLSAVAAERQARQEPRLQITSSVATDVGRSRQGSVNEDSLFKLELRRAFENRYEHFNFYVVCDGMGGQAAGEVASRMAIQNIGLSVLQHLAAPWLGGQHFNREYVGQILQDTILQAHQQLRNYNQKEDRDAGTTLTACCLVNNWAVFANVGDSRTYLFRHGNPALGELDDDTTDPVFKVINLPDEPAEPASRVTLKLNEQRELETAKLKLPAANPAPTLIPERVTRDHSLVQHLVDRGELSVEEVYNDPRRNVILFALGAPDEFLPVDIFYRDLQEGDIILLCSDGLWEMVRDHEMVSIIMATDNLDECAQGLIDQANRNGGADNVTLALVRATTSVQ